MRAPHFLFVVLLATPLSVGATQTAVYRAAASPSITVSATAPNGSVQFGTATWATRLPSGDLAIVDQADGQVRIADTTGRVTRSWGRLGDGPGEFRTATWIGACGTDTLYVWDARATRLSVMHPRAGYVRQMNAPASARAFTATCDRRGNVALFASIAPRRDGQGAATELRTRDGRRYQIGTVSASITVRDRLGATAQYLTDVPYGELLMGQVAPGGGMGAMPRPLGALTSLAMMDGVLVVARTDAASVTWYQRDGSVQRTVALPNAPGTPTDAQYAAAIDRAVEVAPARLQPDLVAFAAQVPKPPTHRPFSQMLAGTDGLLWFVTSLPGDKVTRLRALDRSGTAAATLDINATLELFEIGADYVLGRSENADGEQRVVLYPFARP